MTPTETRELLELAAKAAGIEYTDALHALNETCEKSCIAPSWNPLTDDGDALRLAVKLKMAIEISNRKLVWVNSEDLQTTVEIKFDESTDPYAATRLAIVRAAAEIGRNMK